MSEQVFVDTSCLQYLHSIGLIYILKVLFGKVYIPLAVKDEIENGKLQGVSLPALNDIKFIDIVELKTLSMIETVRDLGKGEASIIQLGRDNPGSLLILDDQFARIIARSLSLRVTGTAGLLIMAKERGFIEFVKPYLDKMIESGFHLSPKHKLLILNKANEL